MQCLLCLLPLVPHMSLLQPLHEFHPNFPPHIRVPRYGSGSNVVVWHHLSKTTQIPAINKRVHSARNAPLCPASWQGRKVWHNSHYSKWQVAKDFAQRGF